MLNENIKNSRKAAGLSQEQLAERLHVVRQTVSKWEQGLSVPDAEMLVRIAQELGCTVNELLGETSCPCDEDGGQIGIGVLADELARINARLASESARKHRRGRVVCCVVGAASLLSLLRGVIAWLTARSAAGSLRANSAIIGGADGPTAIFVSNLSINGWAMLLSAVGLIAALLGLRRIRSKTM